MQEKFVYFNVSANLTQQQQTDENVNLDANLDQPSDAVPTAAESGGDIIAQSIGGGAAGSGAIPFDLASPSMNPPPSGDDSIPVSPSASGAAYADTEEIRHVPPQNVNTIPNPIDHLPQFGYAVHASSHTTTAPHSTGATLANVTPNVANHRGVVYPGAQYYGTKVKQQLERQGIIGTHVIDHTGRLSKTSLPFATAAIPPTAEPLPHSIKFHTQSNLDHETDAMIKQRSRAQPAFHRDVYSNLANAAMKTYRTALQAENTSYHTSLQNMVRNRANHNQMATLNQHHSVKIRQLAAALRSALAAAQHRARQ